MLTYADVCCRQKEEVHLQLKKEAALLKEAAVAAAAAAGAAGAGGTGDEVHTCVLVA
jgi:hypothetical protein